MKKEMVVKSNDLIRKTRYQLNEREQKILIYLISKIDINDNQLNKMTFSFNEFCKCCGIITNSKNYRDIKSVLDNIDEQRWWFENENKTKAKRYRWFGDDLEINNGQVIISLSSSLEPYLIKLKENFTQYEMINCLALQGKYSIRLYELFKSYLWQHSWTISVEELKEMINCDSYENLFKEFNRKVVKKSIDEINKYTDLNITTNYIKQGRNVISLQFNISEKKGWENCIDMITNRNKRLKK